MKSGLIPKIGTLQYPLGKNGFMRAGPEQIVITGGEMIFIEGGKSMIGFVGSEFRQNLQIILSWD